MLKNRSVQTWARRLHIYISMALLLVVLFFTLTGITLNRPELFVSKTPSIEEQTLEIPSEILFMPSSNGIDKQALKEYLSSNTNLKGFPSEMDVYTELDDGELVFGELTMSYKGPGYNASVYLDLLSHQATIEQSDYGVIAWLNDLHKGRNSGVIWQVFIDVTAVLMTLFILTGICLILPKRKTLNLSIKWMAFGSAATAILYWVAIP
ncbi:PepSY-associated TM helix domain-containing protein [Vibrio sp. SCSIO 43136]|uniref:PepSY-associated TM helix domain-containing protein n=1 Tax=Vibrio sp. SCSIO 43136 TaxID=2819101 RepID=UPI002075B343|nr:PepSY-associated TM helix domain-containing protein [Vibrio sp. SCSIO 43136]USD67113.1 PepSY-associated TM helix domain-containing protein [Vibrio sp. SCSIO 43136]